MRLVVSVIGAAAILWAGLASAECVAPPEPEIVASEAGLAAPGQTPSPGAPAIAPEAAGAIGRAGGGRVVAPVMVNGQGPFRFIIDTGANRSVLSARLAERLGLIPHGEVDVHSIAGVDRAPVVDVNDLSYGGLALPSTQVPVLESRVFGAELGLLGVDGMTGRRLRINFERECVEFIDARRARPLRGWSSVQGELRFGHLLVVDARVRDIDIKVLIDTGADVSLGNLALREALAGARGAEVDVRSYTAGDLLVMDRIALVPDLRMGDLQISRLPAYLGDFHIFRLWGLQDEPTLLLGMNVLAQSQEMAIDYHRALLQFRIDGPALAARRHSTDGRVNY